MPTTTADSEHAYGVLCAGGVVLLPTDVGYGLVACSDTAIARIYDLKGRPRSKACVTVANTRIVDEVAVLGDDKLRAWLCRISRRTPIAVVNPVRRQSVLLARATPFAMEQATTNGTIATFLNAGELVMQIAELALLDRRIVVGSSANTAFTGNNYALDDVPERIRRGVDLVIEGGVARYHNSERLATTVLDFGTRRFLREGINYEMIAESWRRTFPDARPAAAERAAAATTRQSR